MQPADQGIAQRRRQKAKLPFLQRENLLESGQERFGPFFVRTAFPGEHQGFHGGADQQAPISQLTKAARLKQRRAASRSIPAEDIPVVPQPFQLVGPGKVRSFTELLQLHFHPFQFLRRFFPVSAACCFQQPGGVFPVAGQGFQVDPQFRFVILHSLFIFPRRGGNIPKDNYRFPLTSGFDFGKMLACKGNPLYTGGG